MSQSPSRDWDSAFTHRPVGDGLLLAATAAVNGELEAKFWFAAPGLGSRLLPSTDLFGPGDSSSTAVLNPDGSIRLPAAAIKVLSSGGMTSQVNVAVEGNRVILTRGG